MQASRGQPHTFAEFGVCFPIAPIPRELLRCQTISAAKRRRNVRTIMDLAMTRHSRTVRSEHKLQEALDSLTPLSPELAGSRSTRSLTTQRRRRDFCAQCAGLTGTGSFGMMAYRNRLAKAICVYAAHFDVRVRLDHRHAAARRRPRVALSQFGLAEWRSKHRSRVRSWGLFRSPKMKLHQQDRRICSTTNRRS